MKLMISATSWRRIRHASRLTSVGAINVMGVYKNKKTQCTIFRGGFNAGA